MPLNVYDENTQEIMSVMENLKHILNARVGSLKHLPDYGLPDLTTVYAALPASAHSLKDHIEKTLLVYETRIRSIEVDIAPSLDPGLKISYVLTCHLKKMAWFASVRILNPAGARHLIGGKRLVRDRAHDPDDDSHRARPDALN